MRTLEFYLTAFLLCHEFYQKCKDLIRTEQWSLRVEQKKKSTISTSSVFTVENLEILLKVSTVIISLDKCKPVRQC